MTVLKYCIVLFILVFLIFKYFRDNDLLYYLGKFFLFILIFIPLNAFWAWENSVDQALYSRGFEDMEPMNISLVSFIGGLMLAFFINKIKLR